MSNLIEQLQALDESLQAHMPTEFIMQAKMGFPKFTVNGKLLSQRKVTILVENPVFLGEELIQARIRLSMIAEMVNGHLRLISQEGGKQSPSEAWRSGFGLGINFKKAELSQKDWQVLEVYTQECTLVRETYGDEALIGNNPYAPSKIILIPVAENACFQFEVMQTATPKNSKGTGGKPTIGLTNVVWSGFVFGRPGQGRGESVSDEVIEVEDLDYDALLAAPAQTTGRAQTAGRANKHKGKANTSTLVL